jgi:hypothetical protein
MKSNTILLYKLELTECSVTSVRELSHSGVRSYAQDHIKITRFIIELATVSLARYFHASVVLYSSRNIYLKILLDLTTPMTITRIARERTETPFAIALWAFSCCGKYS